MSTRFARFRNQSPSDKIFTATLAVVCVAILVAIIYPVYFVLIASVSEPRLVSTGQVILFPEGINFFGYAQVLDDDRIWTGYRPPSRCRGRSSGPVGSSCCSSRSPCSSTAA